MAKVSLDVPEFDDGKAPDALRTIGEVSKGLGIRQHVLRYWEEQFPMLNPVKRSGGRRYYRPDDIGLIATIDRLVHQEGYTLRGACQAIEGKRVETVTQTAPAEPTSEADSAQLTMFGENTARLTASLQVIRDDLSAALAAA
ncbi:MAG: MerR family transcriptional regulator [Novosphingobium sp.]|nr:MerR family transcriptional regulator [Novosphingobium sp.]